MNTLARALYEVAQVAKLIIRQIEWYSVHKIVWTPFSPNAPSVTLWVKILRRFASGFRGVIVRAGLSGKA